MTMLPDGYFPAIDAVSASRIARIASACTHSTCVVAVRRVGARYKAQAFTVWSDLNASAPFAYEHPLDRDSESDAIERLESIVRDYASAHARLLRVDAATNRARASRLLDDAKAAEDDADALERVLGER